jgi:hypothetical protein
MNLRRLLRFLAIVPGFLLPTAAMAASEPATPLFAADDMIRLTIKGPIQEVSRTGDRSSGPRPATLTLAGPSPETHAIMLSPRGITRRKSETCQFSPLRVEFTQRPAATSLFRGQRRLKLVTHCRGSAGFQQFLLLEYAAYRLYNALTPASFRVRLATIDYVGEDGRPITTRLGFFIEDTDDAARRNGMREARVGDRISSAQLNDREAARVAAFQYLIGNLDWSMIAGPAGDGCCHNSRLIAPAQGATTGLVPIPYDFDFTGFVDAPYATPPDGLGVRSVRHRHYRGFCRLNPQAATAMKEITGRRAELLAVLGRIPQLEERTRRKAAAFLDGFFTRVGSEPDLAKTAFRTCTG